MDNIDYEHISYDLSLSSDALVVKAANFKDAQKLKENGFRAWAKAAAKLGFQRTEIKYPGCRCPFQILASFAVNNEPVIQTATVEKPIIVVPGLEITMTEMEASEDAVWIIDQLTQNTIYANPVACAANKRPKEDLENKEISSLWDEEKLQDLTDLVFRDRIVTDHTNIGFRWDWQETEHGRRLVRVKHEFNVDYAFFMYRAPDGREIPARYELVKNAVPQKQLIF